MKTILVFILVVSISAFADTNSKKNPAPGKTRFWHMGAVVTDLEIMHRFYTEILGLENVTDLKFSDAKSVPLKAGVTPLEGLDGLMGIQGSKTVIRHYSAPNQNQFLEFIYFPDHPAKQVDRHVYKPMGWSHLGLQVADIDLILAKMEQTKLGSVIGGPTILKEFNSSRFVMLKDPEGNIVELYELAEEH